MATLAELTTKLSEVETAISTAVTRGLSRITVGSVDKTYFSLKELRDWRDQLNLEIAGKTVGKTTTNYARF